MKDAMALVFFCSIVGNIISSIWFLSQEKTAAQTKLSNEFVFIPVQFGLGEYKNQDALSRLIARNADWEIQQIAKKGTEIIELMGQKK